ncbi:MAG: S1C family serine protease [bacterium]|nr:S1C family serine protease [bacterium]
MKKNNFLVTIILAVIFGLASGIVGEIVARGYLFDNDTLLKKIDFSQDYNNQGVVIRDAKKIVIEQNVKVNETIDSANASMVGIFKKQSTAKSSSGVNFNINNYYQLRQSEGNGLIITSDGWIVADVLPEIKKNPMNYVIITKDKKIYPIDKIIEDTLTSYSFIHVLAKDLPVKKFASDNEIKNGNLVIAITPSGENILTSIINQRVDDISKSVISSDRTVGEIMLNNDSVGENKFYSRAVVFNLSGDVLAMVNANGYVEPISQLTGAINSLLKYKEIKRASLGVHYIDLTNLVLVDANSNNYLNDGAVISKDLDGVAIIKNSSAYLAGLKEGDIIISVDNLELDENNHLSKIIQQHVAGDKINLEYWRQGEKKQVEVVLGQL